MPFIILTYITPCGVCDNAVIQSYKIQQEHGQLNNKKDMSKTKRIQRVATKMASTVRDFKCEQLLL